MAKSKSVTNKEYSQKKEFQRACRVSGISPTKRRASKYRRGFGSAWKGVIGKFVPGNGKFNTRFPKRG